MSKRYQPASEREMDKLENNSDNEVSLRKKIKFEHDYIIHKAKSINNNVDISEYEVNKFLLIFHTLMETIDSGEDIDESDSISTDIILQIVLKITSLLRQNIDSLNLPQDFKNALKTIKQIFVSKDATSSDKTQSSSTEESAETGASLPSSSSSSSSSISTTSTSSSSSPTRPSSSTTEETSYTSWKS